MDDKEDGKITITKKEYNQLIEDSEFLECLEVHGVDNWNGYEDACQMLNES